MRVCLVATYPPRVCGIATFAADVRTALIGRGTITAVDVVALTNRPSAGRRPPEVVAEVRQHDMGDYRRAAALVDAGGYDVVLLQHEYGIFGGPDGRHVLELLRGLHVPVVTTLHTVVSAPSDAQRRALLEVAACSDRLVVLAETAVALLARGYDVDPDRVEVIPHGVPDVPLTDPAAAKADIGAAGRLVLLTFGLLGRGKGIEAALDALPPVVAARPDLLYVVLGATHPEVRRNEGEAYRRELQDRARRLGLAEHVRFEDRFAGDEELLRHLLATDLYVTPYRSREQIVSGTLAYAVGTGRAVVSTPYLHAEELLADGRGRLVPFDDREALSGALLELATDDRSRQRLRERAHAHGRSMVWPAVGGVYARLLAGVVAGRRPLPASAAAAEAPAGPGLHPPPPVLDHLLALTDRTGVLQHSRHDVPDRRHGYTTDDVARALVVAVEHHRRGGDERAVELARTCLAFLAHAQRDDGAFRNRLSYAGAWLDARGSEDTQGQAVWGLAAARAHAPSPGMRALAGELLAAALPVVERLQHTRAIGYALCGLAGPASGPGADARCRHVLQTLAERLAAAHRRASGPGWPWFDGALTYANAKVPEGLLRAAVALGRPDLRAMALEALDFVLAQTFAGDLFEPVGNAGWLPSGGPRACHDQQPIEAGYTVQACRYAAEITGDERFLTRAEAAVGWYLGRNREGLALYDPETGRCLDGLEPGGVNGNSGAESAICCLLGLLAAAPEAAAGSAPAPLGATA